LVWESLFLWRKRREDEYRRSRSKPFLLHVLIHTAVAFSKLQQWSRGLNGVGKKPTWWGKNGPKNKCVWLAINQKRAAHSLPHWRLVKTWARSAKLSG
jgi:hypothetical protein